jgi:hypothetical protein
MEMDEELTMIGVDEDGDEEEKQLEKDCWLRFLNRYAILLIFIVQTFILGRFVRDPLSSLSERMVVSINSTCCGIKMSPV